MQAEAFSARHIIQYWDQSPVPALIAERMRGWKELNPDWEYRFFDRDSASDYLGKVFDATCREAFLDLRFPAMQADVFRVAYLLHDAGLWVDAATLCREPLASWMNTSQPLVLLRRPHQQPPLVWNGLIYARNPGHPFLKVIWRSINDVITGRISNRSIWRLVGPGLYGDCLADDELASAVEIVPVAAIDDKIRLASSSLVLSSEKHWSVREKTESPYFSVPSSDAS